MNILRQNMSHLGNNPESAAASATIRLRAGQPAPHNKSINVSGQLQSKLHYTIDIYFRSTGSGPHNTPTKKIILGKVMAILYYKKNNPLKPSAVQFVPQNMNNHFGLITDQPAKKSNNLPQKDRQTSTSPNVNQSNKSTTGIFCPEKEQKLCSSEILRFKP
jgi:hypothetical protein